MIYVTYLEDLPLRAPVVLGSHTFTAEEVKRFARKYDPQPFHMSEEGAARSHFGRLCASGWHSAAAWMQALVAHRSESAAERTARGEPVAQLGVSPGFRDLHWYKPVYVEDTITFRSEVIGTRVSKSRPTWGIADYYCTGTNQNGDVAISFISTCFIERRPANRGCSEPLP